MNIVVYLTLILLAGQSGTYPAGQQVPVGRNHASPLVRGYHALATYQWKPPADRHWCEQPVRKLRWLNLMIRNAQLWPTYHYGWEVHQTHYRGQEVFILHICRYCGQQRGFLLYNHHGELIGLGEGADSVWVATLNHDRLLAAHRGRFTSEK